MSLARAVSIVGVLALAACAEAPVTPVASLARVGIASSLTEGTDTYLVRFKGNGVPANFESSVAAMGGQVIFAHAGVGIAAVSGLNETNAASLVARNDVAAVDADAYTVIEDPTSMGLEATEAVADATQSPSDPTTAVRYPRQWNMRAISAPAAWAAGKLGKSTTRVGILDTGIGYTHADLVGRVDFAASRSFLSAAENARVQTAFPGAHTIADLHYHGTHVSATVVSNAVRAAGVTSKVTLVGLKVCAPGVAPSFNGTCPTSAVLGGMLYASDIGLDVINLSLGGAFYRRDASAAGGFGPSFLATINSVFNYAHSKGTAVVVSAGNSARDMDHDGNVYNAYCNAPHVICVSATGPTAQAGVDGPWANVDALAYYSNFGRSAISVAAPGGNNSSFVWAACSPFSIAIPVCRTSNIVILGLQGTSMAAPHVTGLAALIAGDVGHSPAAISARIQQSADDLGQPGTDPAYGKGRINVARGAGVP